MTHLCEINYVNATFQGVLLSRAITLIAQVILSWFPHYRWAKKIRVNKITQMINKLPSQWIKRCWEQYILKTIWLRYLHMLRTVTFLQINSVEKIITEKINNINRLITSAVNTSVTHCRPQCNSVLNDDAATGPM